MKNRSESAIIADINSIRDKFLIDELQKLIKVSAPVEFDLESLTQQYNRLLLELSFTELNISMEGELLEAMEEVYMADVYALNTYSDNQEDQDLQNLAIQFMNRKIYYDLDYSVKSFVRAFEYVKKDVEMSTEYYNAQLWKLCYLFEIGVVDDVVPEAIISSFTQNYKTIAENLAYQLALKEIVKLLAEKLEAPQLKKNKLKVDKEVLKTLLNFTAQYKIDDKPEVKPLANLTKSISLTKKQRDIVDYEFLIPRYQVIHFDTAYTENKSMIRYLAQQFKKLLTEKYLEMRSD